MTTWQAIANDFVLDQGKKKRIKWFVKAMHGAKIQTERKMRLELDQKVSGMRSEKLQQNLGKDVTEKMKHYCRKFR